MTSISGLHPLPTINADQFLTLVCLPNDNPAPCSLSKSKACNGWPISNIT